MRLKPITAITVLLLVVASLLVAGCLSQVQQQPTTPTAAPVNNANNTTVSNTKTVINRVVVVPGPVVVPRTPTQAPTYQVVITGPSTMGNRLGITWTATVYVNGVAIPQSQLTNQIDWFVNGQAAPGYWGPSTQAGTGPGTLTIDSNGQHLPPFHTGQNVINAEYLGAPSLPNTSVTATE